MIVGAVILPDAAIAPVTVNAPVAAVPTTVKFCPTCKFFVTAAPPAVCKLPVIKLVELLVPVITILSLAAIDPVTSNAWAGLVLLTPTRGPVTVITSLSTPLCLILIKILDPSILLYKTDSPT